MESALVDTRTSLGPAAGPGWRDLAGAWLAEVGARSGSARTPAEYARIVGRFAALTGDPALAGPADVHAFAYGPGASGRMPAPSTIAVRLAALVSFYDFANRMGAYARNPATRADVRRPRARPPSPRGLDPDELRRLLAAIPMHPGGLRDRAIVLTAVLTGLRRAELFSLTAGSLSRNGRVYYETRTKGGRHRRRELPAPAFAAIRRAAEAAGRPLDALDPEAPIFTVSAAGFYANLRRYAARAGLDKVTPHALRHSAAKLRRQGGASIEDVATLLGHASIATTARYLARLEGEDDPGWGGVAALLGLDTTREPS